MIRLRLLVIFIMVVVQQSDSRIVDHLSYSNPNRVQTSHLHLDLEVDFNNKRIIGSIILTLRIKKHSNRIALDCQGIDIDYIYEVDQNNNELQELDFRLDNGESHHSSIEDNELGQRLLIYESYQAHQTIYIRIEYKTNDKQLAIGWTDINRTNDKQLPLLYTQCESTYCRSLSPIQDSPSIKFTYTADIRVPKEHNVQMSANLYQVTEYDQYKVFRFNQDIPITTYMIALVVGHYKYHRIGHRTGIFAEHSIMDQTISQLQNLEKYLEKGEQYVNYEYPWTNYTIVIVPDSFPPAGMENPQMTFISQNLINDDHGIRSVVIHEIMHSWFGNLVTCRNWTHLWLNEGITTFTETMISNEIRGDEQQSDLMIYNSYQSLNRTINTIGVNSTFTAINPQYHKDNNFSRSFFSHIPYSKGFFFLLSIQQQMGSNNMKTFLNQYLNEFKYSHCDTQQFITILKQYVNHNGIILDIDYDEWIYGPGLPMVQLNLDRQILEVPQSMVEQIIQKQEVHDNRYSYQILNHGQKTVFINYLYQNRDRVSTQLLIQIDQVYGLSDSHQHGIKFKILNMLIDKKTDQYDHKIQQILSSGQSGSNSIYKSLLKHGYHDQAIQYYQKYQEYYHPQVRRKIIKQIQDYQDKQYTGKRLATIRYNGRK